MKLKITWMPDPSAYPESRLFCLDVMRGLDMFLLVAFGAVLLALGKVFDLPPGYFEQFKHPAWVGFSFWDMIMPCFIFMCGAALPLSVERRIERGEPAAKVWKHVLGRVALLWFFGLLVQGNLATLDFMKIKPYSNTLQTIASGYLIAAAVLYVKNRWMRLASPLVLALAYTFLLHFCGNYTETGNFANIVELKIVGLVFPAGAKAFETYNYTWWLTSLMGGAMTMCGVLATDILMTKDWAPWKRAGVLAAYGLGLVALGFVSEIWVPCIKHIFTLSFTAEAMGYCVLTLAALFVLTDIWKCRRGTGILLLYGQHALAAYMLTHFFGRMPRALSDSLTQGLPHLFGPGGAKWAAFVSSLVYVAVLTWMLGVHRRLKAARAA